MILNAAEDLEKVGYLLFKVDLHTLLTSLSHYVCYYHWQQNAGERESTKSHKLPILDCVPMCQAAPIFHIAFV